MVDCDYNNPFYSNYIFTKKDIERVQVKQWCYPILWFRPMYVQINDGYIFKFKTLADGRIFLLGYEEWDGNL